MEWCTTSAKGHKKTIGGLLEDNVDGSNGWEILKAACTDAAEHPEYYPAWQYCLNYASENSLSGDFANGWYLPTLAELQTIYSNKTVVNKSLKAVGGSEFTNDYRSCTQDPESSMFAKVLAFNLNTIMDINKSFAEKYVCSVRAFN